MLDLCQIERHVSMVGALKMDFETGWSMPRLGCESGRLKRASPTATFWDVCDLRLVLTVEVESTQMRISSHDEEIAT